MFEEINLSIIDAIKTYQNMNKNKQPLSPHLSIYRWQVTNTLSIFHRLSGLLLFLAALDFAVWLGSIALGSGAGYRGDHYRGRREGAGDLLE